MTTTDSLRVLVVDDEPLARERIIRLIEGLPNVTCCGEAADGPSALKESAAVHPDVVLLDVRMPGMDGLAVAAQLNEQLAAPAIIFCTAYDEYALDAFSVRAAAYVVKPVRQEALAHALAQAAQINRLQLRSLQDQEGHAEHLLIRNLRGEELIPLTQILYCQADQKYVTVVHEGGETLTDTPLRELEERFPEHLLRIHRNTLAGKRHVQRLHRNNDGHLSLELGACEHRLPVSRRHASDVRDWLRHLSDPTPR